VSLVYSDEDKRFASIAWDNIHTPYYNTSNDVTSEAVGFDKGMLPVDSQSSIFFTKLEPSSFWSRVIGMDLTKIIPNVKTQDKQRQLQVIKVVLLRVVII